MQKRPKKLLLTRTDGREMKSSNTSPLEKYFINTWTSKLPYTERLFRSHIAAYAYKRKTGEPPSKEKNAHWWVLQSNLTESSVGVVQGRIDAHCIKRVNVSFNE